MRIAKTEQLKNEIEIYSQNNQRELDSKEAFIQMLDKNLEESEDQYQIALRNHLIHLENLFILQNSRMRSKQARSRLLRPASSRTRARPRVLAPTLIKQIILSHKIQIQIKITIIFWVPQEVDKCSGHVFESKSDQQLLAAPRPLSESKGLWHLLFFIKNTKK